jgi:hypothetical protein
MTVLQRCATVLSHLIKHKGSPLLAAKVLVLSRLTHKVLSQAEPESSLLSSLQTRLASLRRRLLHVIDQRLGDPNADIKVLVDHMCAFSLTTSATPTDILRHFHSIRLQAIEACLAKDEDGNANPTKAVKILIKTAQASPAIFPRRLSEALGRLKEVPLLQQKDIVSLVELELDIHGHWIAEELRNYTPWPRHDELQKPEADKQLKSWTKQAVKSFVRGLKKSLVVKESFEDVIRSRKDIFISWPWSSRSLPGLDSEEVVDELREILNERLVEIIASTTNKLEYLFSSAPDILLQNGTTRPQSVWDPSLVAADATNGATRFKTDVQNAYFGEDVVSSSILKSYDSWIEEVTSLMAALKSMREDRWDSDLGEEDEDFDTDSRRALLSEDDPRELEDNLSEQLSQEFQKLQKNLKTMIEEVVQADRATDPIRYISLLRMVREIGQRSVGEGFGRKLQLSPQLEVNLIRPLQDRLVRLISEPALNAFNSKLQLSSQSPRLTARLLWEGSPPLPIQPSPTSYRFLGELTKSMASHGSDIWPVGTVRVLKATVLEGAMSLFKAAIDELRVQPTSAVPKSNSTKPKDLEGTIDENCTASDAACENQPTAPIESDWKANDKTIQLLFDSYYLQQALGSNTVDQTKPDVSTFVSLESAAFYRLEKTAVDYWKRTYLMHALLIE